MKRLFTKKRQIFFFVVTLILLTTYVVLHLINFTDSVKAEQKDIGFNRLNEVAAHNSAYMVKTISDLERYLINLADDLSYYDDLKSQQAIDFINQAHKGTPFEWLSIDFSSGESYLHNGMITDISRQYYLDEIEKGKLIITGVNYTRVDKKPSFSVIVPIEQNGKYLAAAKGTIFAGALEGILDIPYFNGKGYYRLFEGKTGNYLALPEGLNYGNVNEGIFSDINIVTFENNFSRDLLISDIENMKSGNISYNFEGNERYASYMPIGVNDWYLMIIVPKEVIDVSSEKISTLATSLVISICLALFAGFFGIVYYIINAGKALIKVNEKLVIEEKRYRLLLERSDSVVFEHDLQTSTTAYSDKAKSFFGVEKQELSSFFSIRDKSIEVVHPEDIDTLKKIIGELNNALHGKGELRLKNGKGNYIWCAINATAIFDKKGKPVKFVGVIENIDERKRSELGLFTRSQTDQLTGLYNKAATESLIINNLATFNAKDGISALLIIDVDNFKAVNDRLGHQFGDIALKELSAALKPMFRVNDILGRIGGDEFFVYITKLTNRETACTKADEINAIFRRSYQNKGRACTISASIGIVFIEDSNTDFETIYKNADIALYSAKEQGKNCYVVFSENISCDYQSTRTEIDDDDCKN